MTRTTELLKEIENWKDDSFSDRQSRIKIKSELKGRLDTLKEEVEFLIALTKWNSWYNMSDFAKENVKNRIASIQEEIKLIEAGI